MFWKKKNKRELSLQDQQVYDHVVYKMVNENIKRDEATQWLIDEGINRENAEKITNYATQDLIERQKRNGFWYIIIGLLMFAIGTFITVISLMDGGGYITYGAIIMGFLVIIMGIINRVFAQKRFIGTQTDKADSSRMKSRSMRSKKNAALWTVAALIVLGLLSSAIYYNSMPSRYKEKISAADSHFQAGEYQEAMNDYLVALTYEGDPGYPSQQIALIKERLYEQNIDYANAQFSDSNYEKAIEGYNKALEYKEEDQYALQRISESKENLSFSYYNDFSGEDSFFTNYKDELRTWTHEDGYYKGFSHNKFAYKTYMKTSLFDRLKNAKQFEISVRVKHISGSHYNFYGLLFAGTQDGVRGKPINFFGITGKGHQKNVGKYDENFEDPWQTELTDTYANESGSWNKLKVVYNGSQFIYYLNGTEVDRRKAEIFGAEFGIYFNSAIYEVWFDDLSLNATY